MCLGASRPLYFRLLTVALASTLALVSCTSAPDTPAPAAKAPSPAAKPAASLSPAAAASPAAPRPPVVSGGAAQPRTNPTFAPIGGSAAIIVPTPNFSVAATAAPAPLAPAVALQTVQPANVVQVVGTLSRIPTAIPGAGGGPGGGGTSGSTTAAGGGSGASGALLTINVLPTSTPLTRPAPQPQPTLSVPR